jgi:hypothetical protein
LSVVALIEFYFKLIICITIPEEPNFITYLNKHKHRIVNYGYLQAEGISIGSGSVESKIKQIAHRLKITGASWESGNVPQVLRHRCAYLNGCLF